MNNHRHMSRALELALQGQGSVEPNPMVGCVLVREDQIVGEGWHTMFGGPHAEIVALESAGAAARGATAYVTLEPCCHRGKTPPCTEALIAVGIEKVVVGCRDPNPKVDGSGIAKLQAAGISVDLGLLEQEATRLIAPFTKLQTQAQPWILAKWAMTLDGKLATHTGSSQWISGEASRAVVHQLRGRMDAIVIGRGTAQQDDPLLTARPVGPRTATRIVLDSTASLSPSSRLMQSIDQAPLLIATADDAPPTNCQRLSNLGAELLPLPGNNEAERLVALLNELGNRQMTNILVEGGAHLFGTLLDTRSIDEVHAFIAPKLSGGANAPSPIAGRGIAEMADAWPLVSCSVTRAHVSDERPKEADHSNRAVARRGCGPAALEEVNLELLDEDIYVHGRTTRATDTSHLPRSALR